MTVNGSSLSKRIDHIAIVVQDLDAALGVYRDALGLPLERVEEVPAEKVKVAFLTLPEGGGEVELVQPTSDDSGVARYLTKRGEGMHHICLEVDDIEAAMTHMAAKGLQILEEQPRQGSRGQKYVFIHPKTAYGVLIELYERAKKKDLDTTQSLREANRLKAELLSTLAHEMRTPLTSIKGYSTALLMEEVSFSPETQREFLQIIDQECDVLQDIIHDLLESSIIDAGLLRLEPEPVILPRLVKVLIDDMAHRAQGYRFMVDFPTPFPIVEADPRRITQVLYNLLDNAVKYSPEGAMVVVRGEVRADEVVISVADQGVGIAPEHLNRLFEKFFRIKSGLGRSVVGSGLGLPIARTIVEEHGGRIWAESQVGQGSTFYFTLPLSDEGEELAEPKEQRHG